MVLHGCFNNSGGDGSAAGGLVQYAGSRPAARAPQPSPRGRKYLISYAMASDMKFARRDKFVRNENEASMGMPASSRRRAHSTWPWSHAACSGVPPF